jgi:hypothetical protein
MNKLDELLEMWKKDSVVDRTEPGREITNIPQLHSKYLNILSHNQLVLRDVQFKINRMKRLKWEYYTGNMDANSLERYGWEPFLLKVLKTYIDSDDDVTKLLAQKALTEQVIESCLSIMKELHSRTFQIKALIEWERFIQGT